MDIPTAMRDKTKKRQSGKNGHKNQPSSDAKSVSETEHVTHTTNEPSMKMLLLGAGASVEAKIPSANKMTSRILKIIRDNPRLAKHGHALSFVVGGLLFDAGIKNKNPLEPEINVEDLFNAVQLLAERKSLEAAPFIGSWHNFVDELDKIYPRRPNGSLQRVIYEAVTKEISKALSEKPSSSTFKEMDKALANATQKILEKILKKQSISSLSNSESIGASLEKIIGELTKKWIYRISRPQSSFSSAIDKQFDKEISAKQAISGDGLIFEEVSAYMIAALKDLVWVGDTNDVNYLAPILNILQSQDSLAIATLNYDNCIELLSESCNIPCETGIASWSLNGKLGFAQIGINLIKLHGSIDWRKDETTQGLPSIKIRKLNHSEVSESNFAPAVIFGSRNKLTAEGPYLDLLREFSTNLDQSQELIVIGYSFRDQHINVYISNWLNSNAEAKITIINGPDFIAELADSEEMDSFAAKLYSYSQANPSKIAFVKEYAGGGLDDLFGPFTGTLNMNRASVEKTAMTKIIETIDAQEAIDNILTEEPPEDTQ